VSDLSDAFLIRARESLLGAESEFREGRYNNVANRPYHACFQAAIAALVLADIRPHGRNDEWGHAFVQSQFNGVLIGRRRKYPPALRDALPQGMRLREQADYDSLPVNRTQVMRQLARARLFVDTIVETPGGAT
jgi:uncharacterized protein (UPF0332 family)